MSNKARAPTFPCRTQSVGEEVANSVSHAIGMVAAIVATPFIIHQAMRTGAPSFVVGVSIFCATMIALYLASAVYHMLPQGRAKLICQDIDHSAIYLLIAGTYTPFTLGALSGPWGWTLFGIIWGLATFGVVMKSQRKLQHPVLSVGLYLIMGWMILIALPPLSRQVSLAGIVWLAAGGIAYTLGVVFYLLDTRVKFAHFIWHLFVLTGTLCHFVAVYNYAHG
ncbi:PAQR family membrane homeostasis protein TrhA [Alkalimonas amylolytica]|uniref:Hemolysin III n=1 Tax=Alkalimonas amylolytica TaxID=152573 RepID=A0A1H4E103_ALKAM|nr:hemolysin III family protein [Alkalimonas amylolytica]SEA78459.1 hemolysin III [Alkalimonas amylolytica]